ncbi:MAG: tRNA (adenine(22)-N(1))-methyltransferase [Christensenellales bacterium]|jgi:tRNA (adenine22-N1)-methyltransferase
MTTKSKVRNPKNTTARLTALAEMLPPADVVADIGSDHGLLCAHLLLHEKCKKAIAVDVSASAAEKAARLARSLGLVGRLVPRLGDGLAALKPGEADAAVIAGLGGRLIASILKAAPEIAAKIPMILQPMQQIADLRRFLRENGFCLLDERMVEENGRIFEMMAVEKGEYQQAQDIPEELADEIGPLLWQRGDPLLGESLRRNAQGLERAAVMAGAAPEAMEKLKAKANVYARAADMVEAKGRRHVYFEKTLP